MNSFGQLGRKTAKSRAWREPDWVKEAIPNDRFAQIDGLPDWQWKQDEGRDEDRACGLVTLCRDTGSPKGKMPDNSGVGVHAFAVPGLMAEAGPDASRGEGRAHQECV